MERFFRTCIGCEFSEQILNSGGPAYPISVFFLFQSRCMAQQVVERIIRGLLYIRVIPMLWLKPTEVCLYKRTGTAWDREFGMLTSLNACDSGASIDVTALISQPSCTSRPALLPLICCTQQTLMLTLIILNGGSCLNVLIITVLH